VATVQTMTSATDSAVNDGAVPFRILGPLFFYFAGAGVATVMLGPLLPGLIEHWHIQDAQAGVLFTALFAGQLTGAWVASKNLRGSVIYGAAITAVSCLTMLWASFFAAHFALFAIGFGIGAGLTAGNVIVGTSAGAGRARALAILNTGWSIGAIACPWLIRLCGPQLFFVIAGCILVLAALIGCLLPQQERVLGDQESRAGWPLPLVPLILFACSLLLYIGIENTLGGWLPSYAVRNSAWLLASSIALYYWTAEFVGRWVMALVVQRVGEPVLYCGSLVLLIAALSTLIFVRSITGNQVIVMTILCGLAIASLYPLLVSFLLARTGNHPRLGPLFAAASLGGATLPWLTGFVSTNFHGLRSGLGVPMAAAVALLMLFPIVGKSAVRRG
jgi:MFS transporter, FHS family, glucose/mannose:H+ symporter